VYCSQRGAYLDGWHDQGMLFTFGLDVSPSRWLDAEDLEKSAWKPLVRPPRYVPIGAPRRRPERVKQKVVEDRQFKDIRKIDELVAEMKYRPHACRREYRLVIVRRNVEVNEPKQGRLFADYLYFIYITNDWDSSASEIKAWLALSLPELSGRWREKRAEERERLLRMEFRTFVNSFVRIPCQILTTGRKIVHRLLAWNQWQGVFFRLADQLSRPLRC